MLTMMTSTSATPIPINTFFQVFMNHPAGAASDAGDDDSACPYRLIPGHRTAKAALHATQTVTLLPGRKFPMQALAVAASVQRQRGNLPSEHYSLPVGLRAG